MNRWVNNEGWTRSSVAQETDPYIRRLFPESDLFALAYQFFDMYKVRESRFSELSWGVLYTECEEQGITRIVCKGLSIYASYRELLGLGMITRREVWLRIMEELKDEQ